VVTTGEVLTGHILLTIHNACSHTILHTMRNVCMYSHRYTTMWITQVVKGTFGRSVKLEAWSDRLNHVWTFGLLLLLAALCAWARHYTVAIRCWCPNQFPTQMVEYTHELCWSSQWVYLPIIDVISIPGDEGHGPNVQSRIPVYYQWFPIVLVLQALIFKLPSVLWYGVHQLSGISFDKLSGLTEGTSTLSVEDRTLVAKQIARYLDRWFKSVVLSGFPWRLLCFLYLLIKILFCVNVITQLVILDQFLAPPIRVPVTKTVSVRKSTYDAALNVIQDSLSPSGYKSLAEDPFMLVNRTEYETIRPSYGSRVMKGFLNDNEWYESPAFPRMILCNLSIRQIQHIQRWTVQCVLPVNQFNEQVYMFLWVWLLVVSVITCCSFVVSFLRQFLPMIRTW
jgi:hypothetical protein